METLIVKVKDDRKLDFVLELLRDLAYVEVSQAETPTTEAEAETDEIENLTPEQKAQRFLQLAGIWKDRDFDLEKMRRESFERRTINYDR